MAEILNHERRILIGGMILSALTTGLAAVDVRAQSGAAQGTVLKGGADTSMTATPIVSTQRRAAASPPPPMPAFQSRASQVSNDDARRMQAEIDKARYSLNATTDMSIPRPQQGAIQEPGFRPRYATTDDMQKVLQAEIDKARRFQSATPTPSINLPISTPLNIPQFGGGSGQPFDATAASRVLQLERSKAATSTGPVPRVFRNNNVSPSDIAALDEQLARARKLNQGLPPITGTNDVYGRLVSKQLEDELAAERVRARLYQNNAQTASTGELKRVFSRLASSSTSANLLPNNEDKGLDPLWDQWYDRIGALTAPLVLRSSESNGNPSGDSTVEVRVTRNQELTVRIVRPSNQAFDQAILDAYRAINHNPALKFPEGSRRQINVFMVDNSHLSEGPVSNVVTRTLKGDRDGR